MTNTRGKATAILLLAQVLFIVLFGLFVDYEGAAGARRIPENETTQAHSNEIEMFYPMFIDIHVMMLMGFGFLMTFLSRYGFGSVGFNFLLTTYVIEWSTLVNGWFEMIGTDHGSITIGITSFMSADFAVAAVLISLGAVLGKTSPVQLIVMATFEVVFYNISLYVGDTVLQAIDIGGSIFIHAFGAYFGLSVARVLYSKPQTNNPKDESVYHSDMFAIIGTLFLWLYWPSFNAGPAVGNERHRAVINTILSLSACTVVTFAISAVVNKQNKIDMVHVQNATLAGGVIMGASADLIVYPFGCLLAGTVAAVVSTLGYKYLQPALLKSIKLHDTCGVHNLHGMPGVLGGVMSAITIAVATREVYQGSYDVIFPDPNLRTAQQQAGYQIAALAVTLAIAIVAGTLTGLLMKLLPATFDAITEGEYFEDAVFWDALEEPEEKPSTSGGERPEAISVISKDQKDSASAENR